METRLQKYKRHFTASASKNQKKLKELVTVIAGREVTSGWISGQIAALKLSHSESVEIVDMLNATCEQLFFGERPMKMLELCERSYLIADHLDYDGGKACSLTFMGMAQWFTSDLDKSLKNLLRAKRIFVNLGDNEGRMKALVFEACVYRSLGDYDQSYLHLQRCAEFFRQQGDDFWEATALMSLAMTCEQIGDYKGGLRANRRIITIIKEPGQLWMVGRALDGIGTIHYNRCRYPKALEYYERTLATCRASSHSVGEARALNDIGMVYQKLGDTHKAVHYFNDSLRIRKEIGQREAQCTCLFNLGRVSLDSNDPQRALAYFEEALAIAVEVGAKPRISQAHKNFSSAYEMMNDCANALRHYKLFQEVEEEVARDHTNTRAQNLRTRLELEKAEQIAEVERQKNARLCEKNDELERLLNELQMAQAQLVQAEKMAAIGKLVAGVAHEMNSPIGASNSSIDISRRCIDQIMTLMRSCPAAEPLDGNCRLDKMLSSLMTNYEVVSSANERLSKIVRSLKSFSSLDEASFQEVDIHEGLDSTLTLLEAELGNRIEVIKRYGKLPAIACYPAELNQVFLNLISNSIEAIGGPGRIIVQTGVKDKCVFIKVCDNGIGIPAETIKTLFDIGFEKKSARVKAGMGLTMSRNIIQKHHGKITVASEVNKGATFTIILPIKPGGAAVESGS